MPELHLPLVQGLDESVDPKVLPQGGLTELTNARFLKDARLGLRHGNQIIVDGGAPTDQFARNARFAADYDPRFALYFNDPANPLNPARWYTREDNRQLSIYPMFTADKYASCLSTLGAPRRYASVRNAADVIVACDVAYAGKHIVEVAQQSSFVSADTSISVVVRSALSLDAVNRFQFNARRAPKAVTRNDTVMVFYTAGSIQVVCSTFDATGGLGVSDTIVTSTEAGRAEAYDVAPYDNTKCLLVYQKDAFTLEWGTVDASATYTAKATITIAADANPAITRITGSTDIVVGWIENNTDVHFEVFTIAGAGSGIDTIAGAGAPFGFPVIGPHPSLTPGWLMAWNFNDGPGFGRGIKTFAPGYSIPRFLGWLNLASKPFISPGQAACLLWCVNQTDFESPDTTLVSGTYKLINAESIQAPGIPDLLVRGAVCEAIACQLNALPGAARSFISGTDPRRFCVLSPSTLREPSGGPENTTHAQAMSILLPVLTRLNSTPVSQYGADLVRIDSSLYNTLDALEPAHLNGQLFLAGSRLREFDGSNLYESGLSDGVELFTPIGNAIGTVSAGQYEYTAIYTWVDDRGLKHRSAPCVPNTIILEIPQSVDLIYSIPAFSDRIASDGQTCAICVEIYRTEDGGSVFYLVNESQLPIGVLDASTRTYNDNTSDTDLRTHEVLYTQGRTGGVSGLLPNDEPPPCRYVWSGNDRLFMGGLEKATAVQWSKLIFPGEPTQFANNEAFKANIDETVTAVACLDGQWFIASERGWWVVTGDGPDDTGAGSFSAPRRLPADVGCISQKSIVEIPDGLLFQAAPDKIYLLPRGGGAPVWIAQAVQTTLEQHPFIMDAQLVSDTNLIYFLCEADVGGVTTQLIYDTRTKTWSEDPPITPGEGQQQCLDAFDGNIVIHGILSPVSGYLDRTADTLQPVSMEITTGDLRPFGLQGRGRSRKVVVLGEALSTRTFTVTIAISYDSGQTWDESAITTITPLAVNDPFYVEHMIVLVKGTNYRIRVTITQVPPVPAYYFLWEVLNNSQGVNGDFQLDPRSGNVWQKQLGNWNVVASFLYSTQDPPGVVGPIAQTYWINTTTNQIFFKTGEEPVFTWTPLTFAYVGGGVVINAITLEYYPQTGTPRLANNRRT